MSPMREHPRSEGINMLDKTPDRRRIAEALRVRPLICGSLAYEPAGRKVPAEGRDGAPLVSIVTVTYNAEASIEAAIQSVAGQTYPNIEYIVIDGGSTDRTLRIVRGNLDHVDCLVSEPDEGIYDAMNKGLLRARGAYVALLNADDRLFPEFVAKSVERLEATGADISYCDYLSEHGPVHVGEIDDGLFLSQLGIKHNTFVMRRECFACIGGFDPDLRIVADAKWNRSAYAAGLTFAKVEGHLVFYSSQGLSAGATDVRRSQIIDESSELLCDCFPCLDKHEARKLYLSNFNTIDAAEIIRVAQDQGTAFPCLASAIRSAMHWNLLNREGYRLRVQDPDQACRVITLAWEFGVPLGDLVLEEPAEGGPEDAEAEQTALSGQIFTDLFAALDRVAAAKAAGRSKVCLHFARVFSAPSETFIYDFLNDLAVAEPETLHVMLCDTRKNATARPYDYVLTVPWDDTPAKIRRLLYDVIWQQLDPARIVAHFALNGWWLHQRLRPEQRQLPWVNMCHGIDVFTIDGTPDYADYIRCYCADASQVVFTAVSSFLAGLLADAGIPKDKIFRVPNAAAPSFHNSRKVDGFWEGKRPLRIVTVGRLIEWKGHDHLLRALARLRADGVLPRFELEIIYGSWKQRLVPLKDLCGELGISDMVRFVDFVDFKAEPAYLTRFDLFVLPSTHSKDSPPRTETFGVALIEAIMAGLPVIGTDAGGLPEVIGPGGPQAVVARHGDAGALAEAIAAMLRKPADVFRDNGDYARSRIELFSSDARLAAWKEALHWFERPRPRILHFCALGKGGAAGASLNVHQGFLRRGYNSWFVTRVEELGRLPPYVPNVLTLAPDLSVDFNHNEVHRRPGLTTFSVDDHAISDTALRSLVEGADLINLTWPAKFLSTRNIAMLTHLGVPVTITLRDMNPITGGCHFFHGCNLWRDGCSGCPQLPNNSDDYPALVLAAKRAAWNLDNVTFVALSDHSMRIMEQSPLVGAAKKIKLSNFCNTHVFHPNPTPFQSKGDPLPANMVKIGYLPSFGSRVKGHHLIVRALRELHRLRPDLPAVLVLVGGQTMPEENMPYPIIRVDRIDARDELRAFYNAVDMVVVPSLEETFSNTTLEALCCGTPVVGFKTGVLEEVLADGPAGTAVAVGDTAELAEAMLRIALDPPDRAAVSGPAIETFGPDARMAAYEHAFARLIETPRPGASVLSDAARTALDVLEEAQQQRKSSAMLQRLRRMRPANVGPSKDGARKDLRTEIGFLRSENRAMQRRLAKYEHSLSWRVTQPVRSFSYALRDSLREFRKHQVLRGTAHGIRDSLRFIRRHLKVR